MKKIIFLIACFIGTSAVANEIYSSFRVGMAYANVSGANYPKTSKNGIQFDIQKGIILPSFLLGAYAQGNAWNYDKDNENGLYSIALGVALSKQIASRFILSTKLGYELINITINPNLPRQYNANGPVGEIDIFGKIGDKLGIGIGYESSLGAHKSAFSKDIKVSKFMLYLAYFDL